jgi:hypothetical protein
MKKIFFTLIFFIIISTSSCAIYRSKFFEPVNRNDYKGYDTIFWVGQFENWDTTIVFSAYYLSRGYPRDNSFHVWIDASTFDKEAHVYRDTNYKANIKSLKILYGEDFKNELIIGKTKLSVAENGKRVSLSNEDDLYVSPDIKLVSVILEMEFIDKENNSIAKKYVIPMKRKEDSSIGPILD